MDKNKKYGFPETPESFHAAIGRTLSALPEPQPDAKGTRRRSRPAKILLAAAAICALLSVTVFAAGKLGWLTRIGNYGVGVQPEQPAQSTAERQKYVKLVLNYLPDYVVPTDDNEKYLTVTDGKEDADGISMLLYTADAASRLELRNIASTQPVSLGEHEGAILRYPDVGDDSRILLVNFEKEGYTLLMYVSERIGDEDLVKIASGIELVGTDDESEAFLPETYLNLKQTGEENVFEPYTPEIDEIPVAVAENGSAVYNGFFNDGGIWPKFELTLTGARITDSIDGLDVSCVSEHMLDCIGDDGKILPFTKETWSDGDGIDTPIEIISTEQIDRRLLLIDFTVKNVTGVDVEFSLFGAVGTTEIGRSILAQEMLATEEFYSSDVSAARYGFIPLGTDGEIALTVGYLIDADADVSKLVYSLEEYRENQPYSELHFDLGAFFR